jgi:hypothetical protein
MQRPCTARFAPGLILLALPSLTGCGAHYHHHHHHYASDDSALAAGVGFVAGAAVVAAAEHPQEGQPVYVQSVVYVNAPPAPPAPPPSPRDRVPEDDARLTFDAKGARAALASVDLATCRDAGAPRGYGHATVTFNPDGKTSKVVVDTPAGLAAAAVKCIGDRLGAVSIAQYEGSYVTVGTTWFVP